MFPVSSDELLHCISEIKTLDYSFEDYSDGRKILTIFRVSNPSKCNIRELKETYNESRLSLIAAGLGMRDQRLYNLLKPPLLALRESIKES